MSTITITAAKLAELLGIDATDGIFDIAMDAWDSPDTVIKVTVCPKSDLASAGLS